MFSNSNLLILSFKENTGGTEFLISNQGVFKHENLDHLNVTDFDHAEICKLNAAQDDSVNQ